MTAVVEGRLDSLVAEITPAVAFTSLLDVIFGWWAHGGGAHSASKASWQECPPDVSYGSWRTPMGCVETRCRCPAIALSIIPWSKRPLD